MRQATEHDEQALVIEWAAIQQRVYPELECLYAIPNGSYKGQPFITKAGKKYPPLLAVRFKKEGLKKGFPDLCLPISRCGYNALYIEMKLPGNKLSPEQICWNSLLQKYGNFVVTCFGADEAIKVIMHYLTVS